MARRDEIVGLLRDIGLPLDDDDIGGRLGINRHYVNQVCRQLAREGVIARSEGPDGKLRNRWRTGATVEAELPSSSERAVARPRTRRVERARSNIEGLVRDFAQCVSRFERSNAFPGPSLYFHERAIARRRSHASVDALMADDQFFEYVYAVLPGVGHAPHGQAGGEGRRFRRHGRQLPG